MRSVSHFVAVVVFALVACVFTVSAHAAKEYSLADEPATWYPSLSAVESRIQAIRQGIYDSCAASPFNNPYDCAKDRGGSSSQVNATTWSFVGCQISDHAIANGYTCASFDFYTYSYSIAARDKVLPTCTSGQVLASGYFDIGTNPNASPAIFACVGGCMASFDGYTGGMSSLVGGVKHYYARGSYGSSTTNCEAGVDAPGVTSLASVPSPACAAGQVLGTVNGKPTCAATSVPAGASASSGQASAPTSTNATTTTTTTNPDGSTTTTKTTTYQNADGSTGKTTTVTTTQPGGSESTSTTSEGDVPNDDSTDEEGEDDDGGTATNTPLPAAPTLYERDSSGGFAEVWNEKKAALQATPMFSFVSALAPANLGDGGCPAWSIPTGQVLGITVGGSASIPCYVWTFIRLVMVISSLLLARRLIFGG